MDNNLSNNNFSPFNITQIISDTSETNKSKTFLICANPPKKKEKKKEKQNKGRKKRKYLNSTYMMIIFLIAASLIPIIQIKIHLIAMHPDSTLSYNVVDECIRDDGSVLMHHVSPLVVHCIHNVNIL